ncbi:MAG: ABC transporter ATP-binding protein [Rubellimicrobium sp.]|nr:ABC transporter ATP-binding protein [Rubellimicrobium sp.]
MGEIILENVSKSFGQTHVIRDLSLHVAEGEFVVFVGPSGCGKSTLLRLIAGLEMVTSGHIRIDGRDMTAAAPYDRGLSMVFQSYALYPHMSVRENIAFALRTARRPEDEIRAKVAEAARMLQLEDYLDRKPAALSGGQRQRVAIGRAVVRHPSAFLFDEPLSNLDAALRGETRLEIARLHRDLAATMIYVTHDQIEAMTLADRIVVLNAGRIMQAGSPRELYERPANTFVAQFIGSPRMNLLPAAAVTGAPAGAAQVGLRPEDITLAADGPLSGRIAAIEYHGADLSAFVDCGPAGVLTVRAPGLVAPREGDGVKLAFGMAQLHAFDAVGNRI